MEVMAFHPSLIEGNADDPSAHCAKSFDKRGMDTSGKEVYPSSIERLLELTMVRHAANRCPRSTCSNAAMPCDLGPNRGSYLHLSQHLAKIGTLSARKKSLRCSTVQRIPVQVTCPSPFDSALARFIRLSCQVILHACDSTVLCTMALHATRAS